MEFFETVKNIGSDHALVVPLTFFVAVLCFCLVIGHLLEENRWVNESITAIIIVYTLFFIYLSFHLHSILLLSPTMFLCFMFYYHCLSLCDFEIRLKPNIHLFTNILFGTRDCYPRSRSGYQGRK